MDRSWIWTVLQDPQVLPPSEVEHKANYLQPRVSDLVAALSDLKRDLLLAGIAVTPTDDPNTLELPKSTLGDFITRWGILQELTRLLVRALVSSVRTRCNIISSYTSTEMLSQATQTTSPFGVCLITQSNKSLSPPTSLLSPLVCGTKSPTAGVSCSSISTTTARR